MEQANKNRTSTGKSSGLEAPFLDFVCFFFFPARTTVSKCQSLVNDTIIFDFKVVTHRYLILRQFVKLFLRWRLFREALSTFSHNHPKCQPAQRSSSSNNQFELAATSKSKGKYSWKSQLALHDLMIDAK
jgi:hypothetical protein